MVLWGWFGLTNNSEVQWRYGFWLATLILGTSLVMGTISATQLRSYCLFCIVAYGASLISFEALRRTQVKPWRHLQTDLLQLFSTHRGVLGTLVAIPLLSMFVHSYMVRSHKAGDDPSIASLVQSSMNDWASREAIQWNVEPSLVRGPDAAQAKMVIAEFADFRCGHCGRAAPTLAAFAKAHPDVRMMFFNFPLDGECNSAIERGDGISCYLARAVHCAGKSGKGWELEELVFAKQQEFYGVSSVDGAASRLKTMAAPLSLDWNTLDSCIQDPATTSAIQSQAEEGVRAKVRGTPSIFVNGRLLERGQLIPVLEAVYSNLNSVTSR